MSLEDIFDICLSASHADGESARCRHRFVGGCRRGFGCLAPAHRQAQQGGVDCEASYRACAVASLHLPFRRGFAREGLDGAMLRKSCFGEVYQPTSSP
jgi:hypothetical protein